jgi:hypothetical protein
VVVVSPRRPLPITAEKDRQSMLAMRIRSLLAVPLVLEDTVAGFLSLATVRAAREWPDGLVERCRLLAEVLANTMARRRAEAAVLVAEERFRRQREELAHALRVNTLGEFGVSLAHEINQPLTAITLNARAMSGLLAGGPAERAAAAEALADIAADAQRARPSPGSAPRADMREMAQPDALIDEVNGLRPDFARRRIAVGRASELSAPGVRRSHPAAAGLPESAHERASIMTAADPIVASLSSSNPARLVEIARGRRRRRRDLDSEQRFELRHTGRGPRHGLAISRSIVEAHAGGSTPRPMPTTASRRVELPSRRRAPMRPRSSCPRSSWRRRPARCCAG